MSTGGAVALAVAFGGAAGGGDWGAGSSPPHAASASVVIVTAARIVDRIEVSSVPSLRMRMLYPV